MTRITKSVGSIRLLRTTHGNHCRHSHETRLSRITAAAGLPYQPVSKRQWTGNLSTEKTLACIYHLVVSTWKKGCQTSPLAIAPRAILHNGGVPPHRCNGLCDAQTAIRRCNDHVLVKHIVSFNTDVGSHTPMGEMMINQ